MSCLPENLDFAAGLRVFAKNVLAKKDSDFAFDVSFKEERLTKCFKNSSNN